MNDERTLSRKLIIMLRDDRGYEDNHDGEWDHYLSRLHAAADLFLTDPLAAAPLINSCWADVAELHVKL